MTSYRVVFISSDPNSLQHFGIKGQKWGVRRFQNEDGTLTEEGKKRYMAINRDTKRIMNQAVDRFNQDNLHQLN